MEIKTFLTGYLTAKVLKPVIGIAILFLLVHQCNRGCGRDQTTDVFDYPAIARTIVLKTDTIPSEYRDSIESDIQLIADEIRRVLPEELIEFAKDHSGQFAMYLESKYAIVNGYFEKIDSTE